MFESIDPLSIETPCLPQWQADDLGLPRSTRVDFLRSARRAWHRELVSGFRSDAAIASVPLFAGLSRKKLRIASQLSTAMKVPAGTVLAHEGKPATEFFVLLEGQIEVLQGDQVIATRGPGTHAGATALLAELPRTTTLVAKTELSTLVSGRQEFDGLLNTVPEISERLLASIGRDTVTTLANSRAA
jgi:CRP/FNR family cyclic AMP-dependent transcriptional regulator